MAAVGLVVAAVAVTIAVFASGGSSGKSEGGPGRPDRKASATVRAAFDKLAETSANVKSSMKFGPIGQAGKGSTTTSAAPSLGEFMPLETFSVDFRARSATSQADSGIVPPSVTVDGVTWMNLDGSQISQLLGLSGWVELPADLSIGVDTGTSTVRVLMDLVAGREYLVKEATKVSGSRFEVSIDTDAAAKRDEERLEKLDAERSELVRAELEDGRRGRFGQRAVVVTDKNGLPTLVQLEVVVNGQTTTLQWELSDFGTKVSATAPDPKQVKVISYQEFSAAIGEAYSRVGEGLNPDGTPMTMPEGQPVPMPEGQPVPPITTTPGG